MGRWIYADGEGRHEGPRALELAAAAEGKRNLFHGDVLLQLESSDRPLNCPPLVTERRLVLTQMPSSWPHAVDEPEVWISEPILTVAVRSRWVHRRQLNEAFTRAVATVFFDRVHAELHARSQHVVARELEKAG